MPTERPLLVDEVSANFLRIEVCRVVSVTDPHGRYSQLSGPEPVFFSLKSLLDYLHEADWTPFQTHCFPGNLFAPGIEPGTYNN
jgi:hypothetical protein